MEACYECKEYAIGCQNGDHSWADFYNLSDDRLEELSVIFDAYSSINVGERVEEFSVRPCEVCGSKLAGERFELGLG